MTILNETEFEEKAIDYLNNKNCIIIRKNGSNRNGFIGRRKPDLVTIEQNLKVIVWELKSPKECLNNNRLNHFWFKHTGGIDYLSDKRTLYRNLDSIEVKIRGWLIVIDGQLKHWLENQGGRVQGEWRMPFDYSNVLQNGGIISPIGERQYIIEALTHLNIYDNWQFDVHDDMLLASGTFSNHQSE